MGVKTIKINELRNYENREGLVLQGCGGDLTEWVDGINDLLTDDGILLAGTKFKEDDCAYFKNGELGCLLFEFNDDVKLDVGKLAMWRLNTHSEFGGTWLSDYVEHELGGFHPVEQTKSKPDCPLIGENGNIFNLMGIASRTLRENDMADEAKEMCDRIRESGSYDEALCIIGEYVNITSVGEDEGEEYDDYDEDEEINMS
ncbi:MAG: hypothetical protein IJB65_00850 [Clostridia bacterium]|nr:hypothetical protein [Clostridia bacterium]